MKGVDLRAREAECNRTTEFVESGSLRRGAVRGTRVSFSVTLGQLSLFGGGAPAFDPSWRGLRRLELAHGAWVEHVPSWLAGHEAVFRELVNGLRWRAETREMYERTVAVPRLYAVIPDDGTGPTVIERMRQALCERYSTQFDRVSVAYYRDGNDSVAWHGDYVARRLDSALVATVSVGAPRRFLLRPHGGGRSIAFSLGWGDLMIMGGTCQRTWQHCIPKVAHAEPRIAIMFRPTFEEPSP